MAMNEPHPKPPVAAVRLHPVASAHGVRSDPYYWLRDDDRTNPQVLAYLEAENAYLERCTAAHKPFENALYEEIVARLKQDDAGVPYRKHGYWYNSRYEPGKEHLLFVRRRDAPDAPEEVILDANALAAGHDYYQVGALEVSPDCAWLAFCEDTVGRRQYTLRFKNLLSGEILQTAIADVESDLAWANDSRTLLYVEKDPETLLGLYVKKHVLGTDPRQDALAFEQKDRSFYTGVSKSKSDRFIFIHMESTVSSEWRYAHADDPLLEFKTFLPHERDHEYQVEHLGGAFIVRTNWRARNFRLMQVPIGREGSRAEWQNVVAHRDDTFIEDFDVFNGFLALSVRSGGLAKISITLLAADSAMPNVAHPPMPRIAVPTPGAAASAAAVQGAVAAQGAVAVQGAADFYIASDEAAYATSLSVNSELDTDWVRYEYQAMIDAVIDYGPIER